MAVRNFLKAYKEIAEVVHPNVDRIEDILNRPMRYLPVVEIEEVEEDFYDLTVESSNYSAAGFIHHNCDPYRNVAGIFMNRIMRKEPLFIFGEGHKRAFSYIEDSLPAMVKAILTDKVKNDVVFIGGKEEILVETLAEEIIANFAEFPKPEIIRVPARPLEVKEAYCSIEKSVKLLGYKETIGWKKGIAKMSEYVKAKGPRPWRTENLRLANAAMPEPWKLLQGKST